MIQRLGPDPAGNLAVIVQHAAERLEARCSLYLRSGTDPQPIWAWSSSTPPAGFPELAAPLCCHWFGQAVAGGEAHTIEDLLSASPADEAIGLLRLGLRSCMGVPVSAYGRPIGSLWILDASERRFSADEIAIAAVLAHAIALEEERLESERQLKLRLSELQQLNLALSNLLKRRDRDMTGIAESISQQVTEVIRPTLSKLRTSELTGPQRGLVDLVDLNLNTLASPALRRAQPGLYGLSTTELKIASLIRGSRSTKEIAGMLGISARTVEVHRRNIRRKLGLQRRAVNLRRHLMEMD